MRIVVLGGGTVGSSIAELLCHHRHSVTVIDVDASTTRHLNETLDLRAITGSASQSSVQFQAGIPGADLCLAVTGIDEVNLVAASMAKSMGARRAVARVYAPVFRDLSTFDYQRHFRIDRLLSLEHLSAMELTRGIRHPGSLALENLARGELEVQELVLADRTAVINKPLHKVDLPRGVRVGSISRDGSTWIAGANDSLQASDRITLLGSRQSIDKIKHLFTTEPETNLGIVIAGGGETGYHLARALEGLKFAVVLMEADRDRCEFLANNLSSTTVVHSDATRRANLEEERVGSADVFVACMGDDENNIMAGVEARELGAHKIMAIVHRPDYANVVEKLGIDHAVSPREVIAKQILGFLNTGPVVSRTALGPGGIVALELEVLPGAPAIADPLERLPLPPQCLIAGLLREEFFRVPGAEDQFRPGDTAIALVHDASIEETVQLFTPTIR